MLDTPPEQAFDNLARLAAFICSTPTALVTFVDANRQWFKSCVGFDTPETSREHSFCQYAMRTTAGLYEIPDATQDPQFATNPLVAGEPHIRFYAGAPLLSAEDHPLGAHCAIDSVPRQLSEDHRTALRILARQVMSHLEIRRMRLQMAEERQKLEDVLRMATSAGANLHSGDRNEIFVRQEQRQVRVATADLQYVEALGDYVNLHTTR